MTTNYISTQGNDEMECVQKRAVSHTIPLPEDNQPISTLPEVISVDHWMLQPQRLTVLAIGGSGYVYKCPGDFVYKMHATEQEYIFAKAAGDCAVTTYCKVARHVEERLVTDGLIMRLETPFEFKKVSRKDRAIVKDKMVDVLSRLHLQQGIIHGDIKPANFLWCDDGKLRLCDFDGARYITEGAEDECNDWEGLISDRYVAPTRGYPDHTKPPTIIDDWYSLAISLWELYTGEDALIDEDMEELLKSGKTVNIEAVEDESVRALIRGHLVAGGARL